jgi:MFS superfamily sulfate permease-like transporter
MSDQKATRLEPAPRVSFPACLPFDALAGFLVFLIALPLCLAIAKASGFPPIAGVLTAVMGGLIPPLLSNSEMTIKGPAAGLIIIVLFCVRDFGFTDGKDPVADVEAYRMALAVGFAAAVVQIVLGLCRAGKLGDFFPSSAVHGLLASIGVIIMAKQIPAAIGVNAPSDLEPIPLILKLPEALRHLHPIVAIIGLSSLAIMFLYPLLRTRLTRAIPVQLVVLAVAIPLGIYLNLGKPSERWNLHPPAAPAIHQSHHTHHGAMEPTKAGLFLVDVPNPATKAIDPHEKAGLKFPNFSVLTNYANREQFYNAWKWVLMFAIIGSLESLLSAKAVDLLDPQKRKTNLNRDLLAIGVANLATSLLGGLPIISEIVRSRANVDNGGKTRLANLFHGLCLLLAVALIPFVLKTIPLAALGAMLVFTGFRLAHPREFLQVFKIGWEQLAVFVGTIIGVLATDLLWGIVIGMSLELIINVINGANPLRLFVPRIEVRQLDADTYLICPKQCAVFSNWLGIRAKIDSLGVKQRRNIVVDLSGTRLVDHTVMERLHELEHDFQERGQKFSIVGLEAHASFSEHPASARKCADPAFAA